MLLLSFRDPFHRNINGPSVRRIHCGTASLVLPISSLIIQYLDNAKKDWEISQLETLESSRLRYTHASGRGTSNCLA